ncbi:MAG TPA: hypothetical protein VGM03_11750 [Phycisphaerae bacterium]|jgi:predicted transposase YdaD
MSKPFDAATRRLLEADPKAWLDYAGLPGGAAELIDMNLTTVTAEADRVLRVETREPYLAHFEFQSTYETDLDERVLRYNALLFCRYLLPVQSVVVLLRREAEGPEVTGTAGYMVADGAGSLAFRYQFVRVWHKPAEEVLRGGLGTLPLAPLAQVDPEASQVIRRMGERIAREASPGEAGIIWTTTYLLMGLRYQRGLIDKLLRGVRGMRESTTYREIFEEGESVGLSRGLSKGEAVGLSKGELAEARRLLLLVGGKHFGPPDPQTVAAIQAVNSLERLETLHARILDAASWQELLA